MAAKVTNKKEDTQGCLRKYSVMRFLDSLRSLGNRRSSLSNRERMTV